MQPAEDQTQDRLATMSRPARRRWNSAERCSSQSHTVIPYGSLSSARSPTPVPTQIAHGGRFPNRSPLYRLRATGGSCHRESTTGAAVGAETVPGACRAMSQSAASVTANRQTRRRVATTAR
jgi:hypothetical protein